VTQDVFQNGTKNDAAIQLKQYVCLVHQGKQKHTVTITERTFFKSNCKEFLKYH